MQPNLLPTSYLISNEAWLIDPDMMKQICVILMRVSLLCSFPNAAINDR